ncbi:MAG: hypothetical protein KIT14_05630 [bacterium]|nr:hypothetical protein [bacterium]
MAESRLGRVVVGAAPVVLAGLAYHGLRLTFFNADDFFHLYQVADGHTLERLFQPHGGHLLAVWHLVFAGFFHLFGIDATRWGLAVLATHLVNTALLWDVIRLLTGAPRLAAVLATCWATAAIQDGTLGWYSVYGQVLATTLLLLTLRSMQRRREARPVPWPTLAAWWAAQMAAAMCFGIGLAVAMALPVVALVFLPAGALDRPRRLALWSLPVALILVWIAAMLPFVGPGSATAAAGPKLLGVTLLYGPRFLVELIGTSASTVVLAPFTRATLFPAPIAVAAALACAALVGVTAWRRPATRRTLAALLVVIVVGYGSIAAGRAALYAAFSQVVQSGAYGPIEPRYHYLGTAVLAATLGTAVAPWLAAVPVALASGAFIVFAGATAAALVLAPLPLDHHDAARRAVWRLFVQLGQAAKDAPPGATIRVPNKRFTPVGVMVVRDDAAFPGIAAVFLTWRPDGTLADHRILFEVADPAVLARLQADPAAPIARIVTAPAAPTPPPPRP